MIKKLFIAIATGLLTWSFFAPSGLADVNIIGNAKNKMAGDFSFSVQELGVAQEYQPKISEQCDAQGCLVKGFVWNETVGWIALDSQFIADTLFHGNPPQNFIPVRISGANGTLNGYAWSENGGWIQMNSGNVTELPINQTKDNWGVFLDFQGPHYAAADGSILGYRFRGFAWSQKLGWIKFSKEESDDPPDFAVFADWYPDQTPPVLNGQDKNWFPVNDSLGILRWQNFASDPQSGIRIMETNFALTSDIPACNPQADAIPVISAGDVNSIDLVITGAGVVSGTPFCHYVLSGVITNNAGMRFNIYAQLPNPVPPVVTPPRYSTALNFYAKAGDLNPDRSPLTITHAESVIADGRDFATINMPLADIAGNPIVDIAPDAAYPQSPGRTVDVSADFTNLLRFDTIWGTPPILNLPVTLSDPLRNELQYGDPVPPFFPAPLPNAVYRMTLSSFAPTVSNHKLVFNTLHINITDNGVDQNIPDRTPNREISFIPALGISNATVRSGGAENQLTIGVPGELSYEINNRSTLTLPNIDIDHSFSMGGISSMFLEIQKIQDKNAQNESDLGWSDPTVGQTRYELYTGTLSEGGEEINGANSLFNYTDDYLPLMEEGGGRSYIRDDGTYSISCSFGIPVDYPLDANNNCTRDGLIDRSDRSNILPLPQTAEDPDTHLPVPVNTTTPHIGFTAEKILPVDISSASFSVNQYIGYRFADQPEFTFFSSSLIPMVTLRDIGVEYTGIGAGKEIYQPDLSSKAINEIDTKNLTTIMRQNVASLTKNMTACSASAVLDGASLPVVSNSCIKVNNDGSVIAFYEGTSDQILTIARDNPDDTISIPNGKRYTLILKGGASLYVKNNLAYGNDQSSFGIILLANDRGEGANLYIDPNPTNMIGTVYAEGSLMSYADGQFFYGEASPELLKNQLLWQGSIVSKNTIGGAAGSKVPEGKTCPADISRLNCAQRYDLDFIRRFTVANNRISGDVKFSGGGSCTDAGVCSLGTLPSVVTLDDSDSDGVGDSISASSVLDPFFIQKDNRRITVNPPPGFSAASQQQFLQEIR